VFKMKVHWKISVMAGLLLVGATWGMADTINLSTGTAAYSILSDTNGCPLACEGTTVHIVTTLATTGVLGPWLANPITDEIGDSGVWIAPTADQSNAAEPDSMIGETIYDLKFSLAGLDPSTALLTINLAADDYVAGVTLNGTAIFTPTASEIANGMWTAASGVFRVDDSESIFNAGVNTLVFTVPNYPDDGPPCCGPTGLDVAGSVTAIPEPSFFLPLILAFLISGFLLRMRMRQL
jgi:hypothetical protein